MGLRQTVSFTVSVFSLLVALQFFLEPLIRAVGTQEVSWVLLTSSVFKTSVLLKRRFVAIGHNLEVAGLFQGLLTLNGNTVLIRRFNVRHFRGSEGK
jgi:hypothetical protein